MSHFLKQKVETFASMDSLKVAMEQIAKVENCVEGPGAVRIYGTQRRKADICCRGRGFGMSRDFGYLQEGDTIQCVCDSMDRHRVNRIEQEAKQHYIANETVQALQGMGFSQQNKTTNAQGQIQLTLTRWR